jgi:hypothetical protein
MSSGIGSSGSLLAGGGCRTQPGVTAGRPGRTTQRPRYFALRPAGIRPARLACLAGPVAPVAIDDHPDARHRSRKGCGDQRSQSVQQVGALPADHPTAAPAPVLVAKPGRGPLGRSRRLTFWVVGILRPRAPGGADNPVIEGPPVAIELPGASRCLPTDQDELKGFVAEMPNAQLHRVRQLQQRLGTATVGRFDVHRDRRPGPYHKQTMPGLGARAGRRRARRPIAARGHGRDRGYIGPENSPLRRPRGCSSSARTRTSRACRRSCTYPKDADWRRTTLTVVYTPNCPAPGSTRTVAWSPSTWTSGSQGFNIDYRRVKMGGLRMWMEWAYQQGALAMHAGAR